MRRYRKTGVRPKAGLRQRRASRRERGRADTLGDVPENRVLKAMSTSARAPAGQPKRSATGLFDEKRADG